MTRLHYEGRQTYDPVAGQFSAPNVPVQVFAYTDTSYATPLPVYDGPGDNANQTMQLPIGAVPLAPDFYVDDQPLLRWQAGNFTGVWMSYDALVATVQNNVDQTTTLSQQVSDGLTQIQAYIAQGGGGGGGLPTGTTLQDIPDGVSRVAFSLGERQTLANLPTTFLKVGTTATDAKRGDYAPTPLDIGAVVSLGMGPGKVMRFWGNRTTTQGPPSEADGAIRGIDYCLLDVV